MKVYGVDGNRGRSKPSPPDSLARHLDWLYGPGGVYPNAGVPCLCDHAWVPNAAYGPGWARTTTNPACPHHGDGAEDGGA